MALNQCLVSSGRCEYARDGPVAPVWREGQDRLLMVLESATLDRFNGP